MAKKQFLFLAILFLFVPLSRSAVTDNSERLLVPAGETYSLGGFHAYSAEVRIDGILKADAYTGASGSGTLEISAPRIYVSSSGRITADMRGAGPDSGPGKPGTPVPACYRGAGA